MFKLDVVTKLPIGEEGGFVIFKPNKDSHDDEGMWGYTNGEWSLWSFPKPKNSLLGFDRMKVSTSDVLDAIELLIDQLPDCEIDEEDDDDGIRKIHAEIYLDVNTVNDKPVLTITVEITDKLLSDDVYISLNVYNRHQLTKSYLDQILTFKKGINKQSIDVVDHIDSIMDVSCSVFEVEVCYDPDLHILTNINPINDHR